MLKDIQNPGSALGEAIGACIEESLHKYVMTVCEGLGLHYISKGPFNSQTLKFKKLLMHDKFGTSYNIDSVIANEELQPLILLEYKYIRYKKHNRDKGSWLCTAHPSIRKRYESIRSSIAVLGGNWSGSSLAMIKSHDINIFLIPFTLICSILSLREIVFDWGEKDRHMAKEAWQKWCELDQAERDTIGSEMISIVERELKELITQIVDDTIPREISAVVLEIKTNLGEVRNYEFQTLEEAIEFLETFDTVDILNVENPLCVFDPPPELD